MGVSYPLEGGCVCGQLRYRVKGAPLFVMACHCSQCKRRTGAAFSLSMLTMKADFETNGGRTITADTRGGSGAMHRQRACPECLTRTHTEMLAYPEVLNVRPGTLDAPDAVAPIAQCWTSAALPWALLPNLESFDGNPPDVPGLIAKWRAAHA